MWRGYWYRFGSLITAVARNPSLTKQLFSYSILGFALTEAHCTIHFNGCV
jgi:F0F1-type ATP synthase membrane subunit c/vacuolar-type H+-ATPase subunit K